MVRNFIYFCGFRDILEYFRYLRVCSGAYACICVIWTSKSLMFTSKFRIWRPNPGFVHQKKSTVCSKHTRLLQKALFFGARRPPPFLFSAKIKLFEQNTHFDYKKPCSSVRGGLRRFFPQQKQNVLSKTHFLRKNISFSVTLRTPLREAPGGSQTPGH